MSRRSLSAGEMALRSTLLATLTARRSPQPLKGVLAGIDISDLESVALRNRVAPITAHAAMDANTASAGMREVHERSAARMSTLLREVDIFAGRCAAIGIRVVALKNAGIARGIHPCPACCPMGDADLLVEKARFLEAHRAAVECGFVHASRSEVEPANLERCIESGGAEYFKRVGGEDVWHELRGGPSRADGSAGTRSRTAPR